MRSATLTGYALPLLKQFLLLTIMLASFTCEAQSRKQMKKEMESWLGSTLHELIKNYGPVSAKHEDGAGGSIVTFTRTVYLRNQSLRTNSTGGLYTVENPSTLYIHRMYYVNKDGMVYGYKWFKNNVPAERLNLNINGSMNVYHY